MAEKTHDLLCLRELFGINGIPVDLTHDSASRLPAAVLFNVGIRDPFEMQIRGEEVPEIMEAHMRQADLFDEF